MNRFYRPNICWLMCPALFLLGACSVSDTPGEENGMFVPVQISSVALHTEVATRATAPLTSGSIGVFSTTNNHDYSKVYNAEYTYNSGTWSSATPITVAGYPTKLCAYHPYGAASFGAGSTVFDLSAQLYSTAHDLSYAPVSSDTQADNNDVYVSFAMVRGYAQLSLAITRQTGYTGGACKISNVSLKNPSGRLQSVRTLDISGGAYTDKTALEALSFTNLGALQNVGITSGTTENLHLLLPPQPLTGLHVLLTIDGVVHSLSIASTHLNKWEAGQNYMVNVSVNDTGVSVSSVSTKEWTNKVIAGGTPPGIPNEEFFVVLPGIGLRVAKGNLMREGGTGAWKLAPDQGYYTGVKDGGDYFCWGIDNPTIHGDNSGTSMDALTAGCVTVLGAGWRVPSKADNEKLAGTTWKWGTYSSLRGESNGCYIGTNSNPSPANQDQYAFFPVAGCCQASGKMYNVDIHSYYWSNESNESEGSCLFVSDTSITVATHIDLDNGLSVRCVADN